MTKASGFGISKRWWLALVALMVVAGFSLISRDEWAGADTLPSGVTLQAWDSSVFVSWTPPTGNVVPVGEGPSEIEVTGYRVDCSSGGVTTTVTVTDPSATSAVVPGLANGSEYTCTVTPTTASGDGPTQAVTDPATVTPVVQSRFSMSPTSLPVRFDTPSTVTVSVDDLLGTVPDTVQIAVAFDDSILTLQNPQCVGVYAGSTVSIVGRDLADEAGYFTCAAPEGLADSSGAMATFEFLRVGLGNPVITLNTAPDTGTAFYTAGEPTQVTPDNNIQILPSTRIAGTVEIQGVTDAAAFEAIGPSLTLDPLSEGGTGPVSIEIMSDGTFSIVGVMDGLYNLTLDAAGSLGRFLPSFLVGSSDIDLQPVQLRSGDGNGDNIVAGADVSATTSSFGAGPGELSDRTAPSIGSIVDFDGDGFVTGFDISIVSQNVGGTRFQGWVDTAAPEVTATPVAPPAPTGEATIALNYVPAVVGTPRFCSAGCAEDVYISSVMETLFRPVYGDNHGELPEQGVLATGWSLDPGLEFMDFDLREGVQFHDGWGEMTAQDVVFSFNDANRNTQPESIHGQAGDFAPLIKNFEVLDTYKARMNYENFDSRGIRHRFSTFWQSAGIVSKAVFDDKGAEGMRDVIVGTGPYEVTEWTQGDKIILDAVSGHWRKTPSVARLTLLDVWDTSSRRALLETGLVIMAQPVLTDWNALVAQGFDINVDSGHGNIRNLGMTGNYWEDTRYYDGKVLTRETADKAWVSDGASGPEYEAARLVRIGLAHAIDRQALVDSILDGWGDGPMYFAYQPPNAHAITQAHASPYVDPSKGGDGGAGGWEYPLDFDLAKEFITAGGYPTGFDMSNVWTGPPGLTSQLMTAIGGIWAAELGVNVTLNNAVYSTYRPGLVARTTSEPFLGCGDDANTSMPYDWARGFVMSSWSDGGYGVGMEIPWAAENYATGALLTDKSARLDANEAFAEKGIENALCIGILHEPVGTVQNPDLVAEYEKLPMANGNFSQFVNLESLVLK